MAAPVIITGGAGFIGSALAAHLLELGAGPVIVVDELGRDQRWRNLAGLAIADYLDKGDFLARVEGGRPLPRPRAVIHLGACSATTEADADLLMRNNFAYSRSLALWALGSGIRFVYASSAATYGDGEHGYDDGLAGLPQLQPRNKYAFSKHAFDLWALQAGAFDAITGLKYFNVFGPNEYHKGDMRSMALKAYEEIQASGQVRLFKSHRSGIPDGEQKRDFIYVADAVAMTAWLLERPEATGIFNIGSGVARSWNDLVGAIFAALGRELRIEYVEMPPNLRAGYQYFTCARLERWRQAGGPAPAWPLERALSDYVQRYLLPGMLCLRPAATAAAS